MNHLTYHVGMRADGKPQVSVSAADPTDAANAIAWVKETYKRLSDAPAVREPEQLSPDALTDEPLTCQIHHVPMASVTGRHGAFYSCHTRNPDGSWCTYRPAKR